VKLAALFVIRALSVVPGGVAPDQLAPVFQSPPPVFVHDWSAKALPHHSNAGMMSSDKTVSGDL
jgi:hypothetical protein